MYYNLNPIVSFCSIFYRPPVVKNKSNVFRIDNRLSVDSSWKEDKIK